MVVYEKCAHQAGEEQNISGNIPYQKTGRHSVRMTEDEGWRESQFGSPSSAIKGGFRGADNN